MQHEIASRVQRRPRLRMLHHVRPRASPSRKFGRTERSRGHANRRWQARARISSPRLVRVGTEAQELHRIISTSVRDMLDAFRIQAQAGPVTDKALRGVPARKRRTTPLPCLPGAFLAEAGAGSAPLPDVSLDASHRSSRGGLKAARRSNHARTTPGRARLSWT